MAPCIPSLCFQVRGARVLLAGMEVGQVGSMLAMCQSSPGREWGCMYSKEGWCMPWYQTTSFWTTRWSPTASAEVW